MNARELLLGIVGIGAVASGACTDDKASSTAAMASSSSAGTQASSGVGAAGGATSTVSSSHTSSSSAGGAGGIGGTGGTGGTPVLPWTKHFGSADDDYAYGVTANAAGETIIQATIKQPIDFGGGTLMPGGSGHNVALAKFDPSGKHVWSKVFKNTTDADPTSVLDDGLSNLFLIGVMEGNFGNQDFGGSPLSQACNVNLYVGKLDSSGGHLWSKVYNSGCFANGGRGIVDANHNLIVAGAVGGPVDFGTGPVTFKGVKDALIVKIASNGSTMWSKTFGDSKDQSADAHAVDPQGNIIAAGQYQGDIDLGGGPLGPAVGIDSWVAKLDTNGNHIWSRALNNTQASQGVVGAGAVASDSQKNTIVAGSFSNGCNFGGGVLSAKPGPGNYDLFVAKYDPAGKYLWAKNFGTGIASTCAGTSIQIAGNDDIVLAGTFDTTIDLGCGALQAPVQSMFLARFAPNGACIWSAAIGATLGETNCSMSQDAVGNEAFFASFSGTLTAGSPFGSAHYASPNGFRDLFLGKFKP